MKFIITILVNAAALWVAVTVLDGLAFDGEPWQWLVLGLIFGVVNAIVKPIAKLLTLPLTIITLGLFLFVLNALMLLLTSALSGAILSPFTVSSFWDAILGGIIVAVVGMALNLVLSRTGLD